MNWMKILDTTCKVLFIAGKVAFTVCAVAMAVIIVPLLGGGFNTKL